MEPISKCSSRPKQNSSGTCSTVKFCSITSCRLAKESWSCSGANRLRLDGGRKQATQSRTRPHRFDSNLGAASRPCFGRPSGDCRHLTGLEAERTATYAGNHQGKERSGREVIADSPT